MKIVLASRNKHKVTEIENKLRASGIEGVEILSLDSIGYYGEIEENGETFEENAVIKASVPASLGYISMADDSGLMVDCLGGEPGVYSARYAGEPCNDDNNNEKLLLKLDAVPDEQRGAKFVSVIAFKDPNHPENDFTVRGECKGRMLREYRGNNGFGYDPLFYTELGKSYAELTTEEKNKISHRGASMQLFIEKLREIMKK